MSSKIIVLFALASLLNVGVNAAPGATSYSSISGHVTHESSISHVVPVVHASPVPVHHPIVHASPIAQATPIVHVAPVVHATPVAHIVAPIASPVIKKEVIPAQYSFEYGVQDSHTGDIKKHHEERNGDVVKGFYTLVQPDGVTRTVHYTSDAHHGFNANVEYKGSPVVQKTIVPVKVPVAAPVHHAYHH